ncbi:MAG: hypothetical protein AAFR44_04455, partial [Pseudomonadota bacterium]
MNHLDAFEARAAGSPWALVGQWYRHQLSGRYRTPFFAADAERQLIALPEPFWGRIKDDPDTVMADIQAIHEGREPTWQPSAPPEELAPQDVNEADPAAPQQEPPRAGDTPPAPPNTTDHNQDPGWKTYARHPVLLRTEWVTIPQTPDALALIRDVIDSLRQLASYIDTNNAFADEVPETERELLLMLLRRIERQLAPDLISCGQDLGPPTSVQ